ncbi:hypothetical protein Tco_0837286 [Tanacetum coccineum]
MEAQQEAQAQELYNPGRRWLLTYGMELAMVKCLKSPEYQGILGHEHGVAGTSLSAVVAYNPETAESNYLDAVRALEEADFPLVHLLKSKKDSWMDEVLDCFLLDGPLADLPEAAHLQPCLEQLSVPIYHADVNAVVGETSLSFALLNNLLGEASTSAVAPCVEDLHTDEDLGSVVCMPQFEDPHFEILP